LKYANKLNGFIQLYRYFFSKQNQPGKPKAGFSLSPFGEVLSALEENGEFSNDEKQDIL